MKVCKLCHVSGLVQGVFFRASTQEKARNYNLTGYAKNLPNGDVEVLVCGETQSVDLLCDWLWQGPGHARVEKVICAEVEKLSPVDFTPG